MCLNAGEGAEPITSKKLVFLIFCSHRNNMIEVNLLSQKIVSLNINTDLYGILDSEIGSLSSILLLLLYTSFQNIIIRNSANKK